MIRYQGHFFIFMKPWWPIPQTLFISGDDVLSTPSLWTYSILTPPFLLLWFFFPSFLLRAAHWESGRCMKNSSARFPSWVCVLCGISDPFIWPCAPFRHLHLVLPPFTRPSRDTLGKGAEQMSLNLAVALAKLQKRSRKTICLFAKHSRVLEDPLRSLYSPLKFWVPIMTHYSQRLRESWKTQITSRGIFRSDAKGHLSLGMSLDNPWH